MTKNANYQDLLKTLAIFAMIADHLGLYLFPEVAELRIVGRFAMPIFVFFAGYNFKNLINLSVLFAGSLLYIISTIFIFHSLLEMNILMSICLGQSYLYLFRTHFKSFTKGYLHFIVLASIWPWTKHITDYGTLVIAGMVIGYMTKLRVINISPAALIMAFISAIHTAINFYAYFTSVNIIFSSLMTIITYLLIRRGHFEQNIPFNLKIVSRHSMLIYFVHVLIIQFIWRYIVF
jgi:surface polysaccharide O-acyltransferase-like enzyme